jgi:GntR family transcriptional regulator/MocR family aminotransferase
VLVPVIPFDRRAGKPIYLQLYEGYREAIISRQLRPGQRLPSTRTLAADLNVSRIPVLNAFEQLLAEGYLEAKTGVGTFVAGSLPEDTLTPGRRPVARHAALGRVARPSRTLGNELKPWSSRPWYISLRAFRVGVPALEHFPFATWSRLVARFSRKPVAAMMGYSDPMGYPPLREAIAAYLSTARAVRCEPEQIMVVNGSQQALQITARVLLDPGSSVWIEEPGYPGAQDAFRMARASLIPVPVDEDGLDVAAGAALCPRARAVYVTPSHQYPLGMTMSASRRLQLLNWAMRSGAWIIEDDYDSEYRYVSRPVASLQGMDRDSRIIYLGTFSKVMFPALRLGYIVIPKDLVGLFAAAREVLDICSPTLYQVVLTEFINEGHFGRHIRRMRMLYRERCEVFVEALKAAVGSRLEVLDTEAGMHLVALLPQRITDTRVSRKAAAHGISAMPLSDSYLKPASRGGLILGYGNVETKEIRSRVRQLALALNAD